MSVPDFGQTKLGIAEVVVVGQTVTIVFLSHDKLMRAYGELVSTQTSGCATKWTGVLVVDDPSLEE